jgi:hypothetical protein
MKKVLLIAALAGTALIQAQPSQAYFRGAWCAKIDIGGGVNQERCDFPDFATCRAYVNSQPRSFCIPEPVAGRQLGRGRRLDRGTLQPPLPLSGHGAAARNSARADT